jgi:outer membrane protein assembly factor BamB
MSMPKRSVFISGRSRRRPPPRWGFLLAGLLAVALAGYLFVNSRGGDVHNGGKVEFVPLQPAKPPAASTGTNWPFFHYDLAHRGYLPAKLKPPFKRRWLFSGHVLMEFPPIVVDGSVYFIRNNGGVYALDADTGKIKWKRRIGKLSASSPGYADGRVFVSSLTGKIVALSAARGKVLWQKQLGVRTESSPIIDKGVMYFGTEGGTLYALYAKTGRVKWKYKTSGAIKASPALDGGTLYVGDYSGRMYAVWAKSGNERWSTGTSGAKFGFASGEFYSTPAVDFGRVYAGNTDSKVYSFGAKTGDLAWTKSTGGYVYSSPATANVPRHGPTVFIGSYDGKLYALDARSGSKRWSVSAGGRISGGVSIIGNIAYYADLDSKATYGADIRTGRRVYRFPRGAYNPVISDGEKIYLTGYASLTALAPKRGR